MAKPAKPSKPTKRPAKPSADDAAQTRAAQVKSNRRLLMVAALMCVASLGGGFVLARIAYLEDAASYEPGQEQDAEDTTHTQGDEDHAGSNDAGHNRITDPLAQGDHPAGDAIALQDKIGDEDAHDSENEKADDGLLDFGEVLTNIASTSSTGETTKAFLKVNLIVVYRTDPGAADIMKQREPFMRDLFNAYLRGLTEADVRGMSGIVRVKAQLLKRARAAVGSDLPEEILISDLIVQ